ncbi:MAG: Rieske 2Fe-2S domain-containing protein [Thermomicrobiales bacterium]
MLSFKNLSDKLVDSMPWLDTAAYVAHTVFEPVLGANAPTALKNALYGTWLGHPLHPAVTDLPIGFWSASMLLDACGMEDGADIALNAGTLSALGAAVTGMAQWHDLQEEDQPRRLGILHALINVSATTCYGISWVLRDNDSRKAGIGWSLAGGSLMGIGALLGGDLSFRLGVGVSRIAYEMPVTDWTDTLALDDLEEGTPKRFEMESVPLVLVRQGDQVLAASATCPHVGGPLDEGTMDGACVTCPWHGSIFDLRDGSILRGPATSPLQAYETRVHEGTVQVKAIPAA